MKWLQYLVPQNIANDSFQASIIITLIVVDSNHHDTNLCGRSKRRIISGLGPNSIIPITFDHANSLIPFNGLRA